jgi:hypothetical protein
MNTADKTGTLWKVQEKSHQKTRRLKHEPFITKEALFLHLIGITGTVPRNYNCLVAASIARFGLGRCLLVIFIFFKLIRACLVFGKF